MPLADPNDPEWRGRTRRTASVLLFVGIGSVALSIRAIETASSTAPAFGLLFGPAVLLVAGGALVHPPLLYTFGPRRPHLTSRERVIGTALAVVGGVIGVASTVIWFAR